MNDILTMRTELANDLAEAGAKLLHFTATAGALAAIPDTEPQQYVVAGTLDSIQKVLPIEATPARRKDDRHPVEALQWEGDDVAPAATSGDAPTDLSALKELAQRIREANCRPMEVSTLAATAIDDLIGRIERSAAPAPTESNVQKVHIAPATESGDLPSIDTPEFAHLLCELFTARPGSPSNDARAALVAYINAQARAAVSAATKPTADLSNLTRYSACGVDHMGIDEEGMYVLLTDVQSLLATKPAAPAVPEGYKVVPINPTPEMLAAVYAGGVWDNMDPPARVSWDIMIAAAPAAPAATKPAAQTAWEQYADIVKIQRREAESDPQDHYMRGLYNGIVMMCSNFDGIDYPMMAAPAATPAAQDQTDEKAARAEFEAWAEPRGYSMERTTDSYKSQGTKSAWRGWWACVRRASSGVLRTGEGEGNA